MTIMLVSIFALALALAAAVWIAWQRTKDLHRSKLIAASVQESLLSTQQELGQALDRRLPVRSTELRQHIRAMRQAKGWSQAELGKLIGVCGSAVCNLETKEARAIGADVLRQFATAFGEPILVSYEPTPRIEQPTTKKPATPRIEPTKPRIEPTPKSQTKKRKPDPLVALDAAVREALSDELSESPIIGVRDDGRYHICQRLWNDERFDYIVPQGEPIEQTISKLNELKSKLMVNPYAD